MESYRRPYRYQEARSNVQERKRYNGLRNQGATCYLNSVLQCLYMTEDFRKEVENFGPDQRNSEEEILVKELQKLFKEMKEGTCTTKGITRSLGITNVYEQEDVVEYYQKTLKAIGPQLSKIFEGKISNRTKCLKGHIFEEECNFFTIPLAIEGHHEVFNVDNGLKSFLKPIKLDEDNWLYCKDCRQKNETETWNEIKVFPTILTLYPKRFYFDYDQMRPVKNHCPMEIPPQLKISNMVYELYAVINHMGNESGGHYNAVIKSSEDDMWYCFDDTSVRKDSEYSFKHSQRAYLLMYRKVDSLSPDEKSTNELQLNREEYQKLVTELLQMIQKSISEFKETKLPTNYKETEILCHKFLVFKMTHLPGIEAKIHTLEVAMQASQIKVALDYHPISVEKEWCELQKVIIKRERLLMEFEHVYCFHHQLVSQCMEYRVPLTHTELDNAMLCYIQDLLVWVKKKQMLIQNMEWGADLGIRLHQSIMDFKLNIDHAQADENQLTPTNKQAYRNDLDKLNLQYNTLLDYCTNYNGTQHHNNLPQSLKKGEQEESVCKSYIIQIRSLKLRLDKYGLHIISCLRQPVDMSIKAFPQGTTEQKEMLENIRKELDAVVKQSEAVLTSIQWSTWANNLHNEINHTMNELEHVYSLFSCYLERAKSIYLEINSTQGTGDVPRKYENLRYDFHKVPANEKELESNQEPLKELQLNREEYQKLVTELLQMIQKSISEFKETKLPTNYKETEILCHKFLVFKMTHLPGIEAKIHTLEVAMQASQIKVALDYHPISVEKEWCELQKVIIKRERLLMEFEHVYCFHHQLVSQCMEYRVPLTHTELDNAMLCYIQDLLVWVKKKQMLIQNMEWGADLGIRLHQSIMDFKLNIDHAQADENQLTPTNKQAYRNDLDKLNLQYNTLLDYCTNYNGTQHHNNLPQSLKKGEQEESVCKSYIIQIRSLKLRLDKYGLHIISCLRQPVDMSIKAFPQGTTEQKEMLENIRKELDAVVKQSEAVLTSIQWSTWANNLHSEINHTMNELEHVYSLFSCYLERAKSIYLEINSTQGTGDVPRKYENLRYDFHKVPANEKELESNQEPLKVQYIHM
ncbi:plectin-like isoform X2 [Hemibagrus wyckioides]|uniref:plectin-like isoform X2 n=1 Tax=Hemibagrus wyckioides TaxID=337641 RepID=UPI00266C91E1|nr:plectin-like isoform X2 [Hemibagrus wyckioides]